MRLVGLNSIPAANTGCRRTMRSGRSWPTGSRTRPTISVDEGAATSYYRNAMPGDPLVRASQTVTTARLLLRRPLASDTAAIFTRYSSDPEVTRYVGWPTHTSVDDTRAFLAFSDDQWDRWPAGPYLVCSRADGAVLGSTGLMFEAPATAMTGYVFATDAWGQGYATEALD